MLLCYPIIAVADCSCGDTGCYRLTVKINGFEDYVIHDELVMIRYYGGNESSPILYESNSIEDGIVYFCIEDGDYWIDVRNIWERITIDSDIDFVFPYLLFEDIENSTENNQSVIEENPLNPEVLLWSGIAVIIIVVTIVSLIVFKKRKKKV